MDINITQNIARTGLATDLLPEQSPQGYITDAMNAMVNNFDGSSVSYSNEPGNVFCFILPEDYKVVGRFNITQLSQVWYFTTNDVNTIIGYVHNNNCTFIPVLNDNISGSDLIGLDTNHPIHKVVVKTTNCSTQLYWTDRYNVRRYIDLQNLPWKTGTTNQVDTNKMNVQPQFNVPVIIPEQLSAGGILIEGDYQFAIQYSNARSEGLTSWYSVTNPVRIFLEGKVSLSYNEVTNSAIRIQVNNLDLTGLYSYFNLAVIKTINGVTSVEMVGTYPIQTAVWTTTYTGSEQSGANKPILLSEILRQFDYYDIAGDLTTTDQTLIWADLQKEEDISYQQIWNQVKIQWQTHEVPVGQNDGYSDGVVCANFEGYFRDEVYALEGCFILDNGKQTPRCHIPGRAPTTYDLQTVLANADLTAMSSHICPPQAMPRWKVYNTGSVIGPLSGTMDPCTGVIPHEYGEMAYYESEEKYPNNTFVWGPLANQPIRHHRFPDSLITHIHDGNINISGTDSYFEYKHKVYPIGILLDTQSLWNAIQTSSLTDAQKRQIVGFKVMRGDRAGNNQIIAKGYAANCGAYAKDSITYYYPNYPFNDVHPDPFISSTYVEDKSGANSNNWLNDFQRGRFTFHSPDTHFYQAAGIQDSFVKLETAEWGKCKSHFIPVLDNAGEKILTEKSLQLCLAAGIFSMIGIQFSVATEVGTSSGITTSITPVIEPQNFFPSFNTMLEIITKLTPYYNYGWQYNGIGYYGNYTPIPNDTGNKIRVVEHGGYINNGLNTTFGDDHSINNTNRESSVYLSLNQTFPYTHEQVNTANLNLGIPADTSRVTANMAGVCGTSVPFYKDISSYYCSIKRWLNDQYGQIFSYRSIDTGYNGTFSLLADSNGNYPKVSVFGGDCFINRFGLKIKHPFYLKSTVNKPDGFDINYNQDTPSHTNTGNVGYPIWYYSTTNHAVNTTNINNAVNAFMAQFTGLGIVSNILLGGIPGMVALFGVMFAIVNDALLTAVGLKITNLDCYDDSNLYEQGQAYLYAYGIIYYFCESEVNVDMRQAYNLNEGNFYPNVGTDIPDPWLQETNTPIVFDNTYTYNKTYSKQNHETAFTLLRPDWQPDQRCYIDYNNRAIWSDKTYLEETKNNWLVYKPANTHDFEKVFGTLQAIDALDNREILVRYENYYEIYNVLNAIETTGLTASMGTGELFSTQPIGPQRTDTGNMGTSNKMFLSTEYGRVWIDADRGQVLLLQGHQPEDLASPKYLNSMWFTNNLPWNIRKKFPDYPVDNHFNNIGLHGVYDNYYKRLIFTKIDYEVINPSLKWDGNDFYITSTVTELVPGDFTCCPEGYTYNGVDCTNSQDPPQHTPAVSCGNQQVQSEKKTIITLGDPRYFCNKSWTISFSFISNSWVSWHSYQPNFYVEYTNYFQTGWNDGDYSNIWDHNTTFTSFQDFRGTVFPYMITYPVDWKGMEQILQYTQDYCTALKYTSLTTYTELNEYVYYNKMIVHNTQQCTGMLYLVPKDMSSMRQYREYPKYNANYTEVLISKSGHMYTSNMLWDKVIDQGQAIWEETCGSTTGRFTLNQGNLDYGVRSFRKYPIRAKDTKVTLIQDTRTDLKFISRFIINQSQDSYI